MDAAFVQSLLPAAAGVRITAVTVEAGVVAVSLATTSEETTCPRCGSATTTVHGRYPRTVCDRPCLGPPVAFAPTARKFVCRRADRPRRVFCERLPGPTAPHARTTGELADAARSLGSASGGEAGARLAAALGLPTSPDTILRRVKAGPDAAAPPPRYVGIDDRAARKGHACGTIVIDLERGTVLDLLPGRDGEAVKTGPAADPQVEVITRDRWPAYIQAATAAAPQAKRVADRFHLSTTAREAVEKIRSRVATDVRTANAGVNAPPIEELAAAAPPAAPAPGVPSTGTRPRKAAKRQTREERFRRVKELTAAGLSIRLIARPLRMGCRAVLRYQRPDRCPDWQAGRTRPTTLDPFAAFIADWIAAGNRNSRDPCRALRAKGLAGGYAAARRYLNRRIGSTGRPGRRDPTAALTPTERPPPSARRPSLRAANPEPDGHSAEVLPALRARNPAVHAALAAAEELTAMIRQTKATTLAEWDAKATALDRDLSNRAAGLASDAAAVQAALTEAWSNGPVEGQVGRLKCIKRQVYGRAGMKLLRARVRHKG